MKFTSQICTTKEQSERLLALGLSKETADMMFIVLVKDFRGKDIPVAERVYSLCTWYNETSMRVGLEERKYIPAWSLHRLLYLIPNEYFTDVDFQNVMQRCIFATSTLYDDLIDLIEALIKEEYFYKEYLKD